MRKPALDLSDVVRHLLSSLSLLLLFSVAANAKVCVRLDYDNSAVATVSGHITKHHKLPKGSELRTGDGPWLILDHPFLTTDESGECYERRKITILSADSNPDDYSQLRRLAGQHVTIEGELGRFGSALVSPSIFIRIRTIKKD
jgi:hypothetical protein